MAAADEQIPVLPPGVTVVAAVGELDARYAPTFRTQVDAALTCGTSVLVLDLARMPLCGALGIAELLHAQRGSQSAGVDMILSGVHRAVADRMDVAGITPLFTLTPDLATALRSLPAV